MGQYDHMSARAYTTLLADEYWQGARLEIVSIPSQYAEGYSPADIAVPLGLSSGGEQTFGSVAEIEDMVAGHFSQYATVLGGLVGEAFSEPLLVTEQSPAITTSLKGIGGAGAILMGTAVWGPWAIIAVPVGVFLLTAARPAGQGFGEMLGSYFRSKAREFDDGGNQ